MESLGSFRESSSVIELQKKKLKQLTSTGHQDFAPAALCLKTCDPCLQLVKRGLLHVNDLKLTTRTERISQCSGVGMLSAGKDSLPSPGRTCHESVAFDL